MMRWMHNYIPHGAAMLMAAFVWFMAAPLTAHQSQALAQPAQLQPTPANDTLQALDANGQRIGCRDIPEAKGGAMIGYIVPCIIFSLENTSIRFSEKMIEWLMPTVWAFVTFVIVLFGVKIVQGEGDTYKQGILLLLKIGLVVGILHMIPTVIIPQLYGIMKEGQQVVSSAVIEGDVSDLHCEIDKYGDENTLPLWKQLDCVMGKLFGFAMGEDGRPGMLLVSSVFGLLGGFFFGGTFGMAVFAALIGMLWFMFSLILRTVFLFLNAYMFSTILLMVAPLFLPLTLLKVTTSYFDKWWSAILASLLLPLIISVYVMFALMVYDQLFLGPNATINNIVTFAKENMALAPPQQACDKSITGPLEQRAQLSQYQESAIYNSPFMKSITSYLSSGANNLCAGLNTHKLDVLAADPDKFESTKQAFTKIFMESIKMLILAMLVSQGFDAFKSFSKLMIGSFSAASLASTPNLAEVRLQQGAAEARRGFLEELRTDEERAANKPASAATGADFLGALPRAIQSAVGGNPELGTRGFFGGIIDAKD